MAFSRTINEFFVLQIPSFLIPLLTCCNQALHARVTITNCFRLWLRTTYCVVRLTRRPLYRSCWSLKGRKACGFAGHALLLVFSQSSKSGAFTSGFGSSDQAKNASIFVGSSVLVNSCDCARSAISTLRRYLPLLLVFS